MAETQFSFLTQQNGETCYFHEHFSTIDKKTPTNVENRLRRSRLNKNSKLIADGALKILQEAVLFNIIIKE